jgi:hypothetical protein
VTIPHPETSNEYGTCFVLLDREANLVGSVVEVHSIQRSVAIYSEAGAGGSSDGCRAKDSSNQDEDTSIGLAQRIEQIGP